MSNTTTIEKSDVSFPVKKSELIEKQYETIGGAVKSIGECVTGIEQVTATLAESWRKLAAATMAMNEHIGIAVKKLKAISERIK